MEAWLRSRKLAAFLVLPDHTAQLTAFRDAWRASTGAPGEADYARFGTEATTFLRRSFHVLFWSRLRSGWTYIPVDAGGASIVSPYRGDWPGLLETDHSMGSPDGPNLWLDRWCRAKRDFAAAWSDVKNNAQMRWLRAGAREAVDEELTRAIATMKAEFAALYALSRWDPGTPIPDTSRVGSDVHSKWYAGRYTFCVSRDGRGRVLLSDPQGLQAQLRGPLGDGVYLTQLEVVARLLAAMPGDFGHFEARIEAKLADIALRQTTVIGEGVADGLELFR